MKYNFNKTNKHKIERLEMKIHTDVSLIKLVEGKYTYFIYQSDLIFNYESLDFTSLFQNDWINSVNRFSIVQNEGWSKAALTKFREKLLGQDLTKELSTRKTNYIRKNCHHTSDIF